MIPTHIVEAYRRARHRLLLLDYDGTLIDFAPTPDQAHPTEELFALIKALAMTPGNTVAIVSGRDQASLESAFGQAPVSLAAEHGFYLKELNGPWRAVAEAEQSWKPMIRQIMQAHAIILPGTFVEEKTMSLVWHYRQAAAAQAHRAAHRLAAHLNSVGRAARLRVMHGHKIVEVRTPHVDKGKAAQHWLEQKPWDFILAAGDDTTDEDMFTALPAHAFSIKVGRGHTIAKFRLPHPEALRTLLAASMSGPAATS